MASSHQAKSCTGPATKFDTPTQSQEVCMHNTSFNTNEDGMESAGNNEQPNIKTEYPSHHEAENTLDVDKRGVKDKATLTVGEDEHYWRDVRDFYADTGDVHPEISKHRDLLAQTEVGPSLFFEDVSGATEDNQILTCPPDRVLVDDISDRDDLINTATSLQLGHQCEVHLDQNQEFVELGETTSSM